MIAWVFLALLPDAGLCASAVDVVLSERPTVATTAPRRWWTCNRVARAARRHGVEVELAVAVAWRETRFRVGVCSDVGACGPMQAVPRWWCPDRSADGCDLVAAGARALAYYTATYPTTARALCHYSSGSRCGRAGRRYASEVLSMAEALR